MRGRTRTFTRSHGFGLLVLTLFAFGGSSDPARAGKIYWPEDQTIRRASLDGSNVETVIPDNGIPTAYTALAFDLEGGWMYWASVGNFPAEIHRSDLDGSNDVTLISGLDFVGDIALDLTVGKMYWTDGDDAIRRADIDDSNVEVLVEGLSDPRGIALDLSAGKMYWSEPTKRIRRADLDGSNVEVLVETSDLFGDIAIDPEEGKIYWVPGASEGIGRADLDGSNVEYLDHTSGNFAFNIALDLENSRIYWSENYDCGGLPGDCPPPMVRRTNMDESPVEDLAVAWAHGIALAIYGVCGDGTLDPFEDCDDGNTDGGDDCSPDCTAGGGAVPALTPRGGIFLVLLLLATSILVRRDLW